jgi:hypothetical protein
MNVLLSFLLVVAFCSQANSSCARAPSAAADANACALSFTDAQHPDALALGSRELRFTEVVFPLRTKDSILGVQLRALSSLVYEYCAPSHSVGHKNYFKIFTPCHFGMV